MSNKSCKVIFNSSWLSYTDIKITWFCNILDWSVNSVSIKSRPPPPTPRQDIFSVLMIFKDQQKIKYDEKVWNCG